MPQKNRSRLREDGNNKESAGKREPSKQKPGKQEAPDDKTPRRDFTAFLEKQNT